jgi:hypothetical protein
MKILNKVLIKLHLKKSSHPKRSTGEILPPAIKEALESEHLDTSNIIYGFKSDMCGAEEFGDCYIFFDSKGVYTASFEDSPIPKSKKKKIPEAKPKLKKLVCIPTEDVDEIFAEQYLATGQLTYTHNGEYYSLAAHPVTVKDGKISAAVAKLVKAASRGESAVFYIFGKGIGLVVNVSERGICKIASFDVGDTHGRVF